MNEEQHLQPQRPWLLGMSPLEKAFNSIVILLCQEISKKDAELEKLQDELAARPKRAQLAAAEQRELRANDSVHTLQRRVIELEKQLQDTREANVALVRQKKRGR